ncbi:alpha/beta hydrolase [Magnetospirillum sp. SS-4]|uniref:alpha/beta hydrolase n=1 Tax=Magnetospirillum sp. SS-4 TaxID=2681465 RepID=UPI00137FB925|nr:alpha/beta hydrolase [Magnetospirillum sp. SS-4]CAA7612378.1 Esterase/lipase/thioesterase [Magnetospirillum sp. SS-4]
MARPTNRLLAVGFALALSGCAGSTAYTIGADRMAQRAGMGMLEVATERFTLLTYARLHAPGKPVTIYIEDEGRVWFNQRRTTLSVNPTPDDPVALRLAVRDPSRNVAYVGRPCQYVELAYEPNCGDEYWLGRRYSPEVVAAMSQAVDRLKARAGAPAVHLVGFGGGAAIAMLVAVGRSDVASLRSVAGILDHRAVPKDARLPPLDGSLNPIDVAGQLARVPQILYSGGDDREVPPAIAEAYAEAAGPRSCIRLVTVSGLAESRIWPERWAYDLLTDSLPTCGQGRDSSQP